MCGNLNHLEINIKNDLIKIVKETKDNDRYFLNLAIGYDGRTELVKATSKLSKSGKKFTRGNLNKCLDLKSDIDIVIRTGYEKRM